MESNKLIAEFMDVEKVDDLYLYTTSMDDYKTDTLYFDVSWDWLMPVVETCFHNGADENHIGDLTHALLDCNLEWTYKAVVLFIKEYNRNK